MKMFGGKKRNFGYDSSKRVDDNRRITYTDRRTGEVKRLLTPKQKGRKFAHELKTGVHYTNEGRVKLDKMSGQPIALTKEQRAYRAAWLDCRRDAAKARAAAIAKEEKGRNTGNFGDFRNY